MGSLSGWPAWRSTCAAPANDCGSFDASRRCCPQGSGCAKNADGGVVACCDPRDPGCLNDVINNGPYCAYSGNQLYRNQVSGGWFCCDSDMIGWWANLTMGCASSSGQVPKGALVFSASSPVKKPILTGTPTRSTATTATLDSTTLTSENINTNANANTVTVTNTNIDSNAIQTTTAVVVFNNSDSSNPNSVTITVGGSIGASSSLLSSQSPNQPSTQSSTQSSNSSIPVGAIVGIAIPVALLIIGAVLFFLYHRKTQKKAITEQSEADKTPLNAYPNPPASVSSNHTYTATEPKAVFSPYHERVHELSSSGPIYEMSATSQKSNRNSLYKPDTNFI